MNKEKQLDGHKSLISGFFSYCHLKQIILVQKQITAEEKSEKSKISLQLTTDSP